MTLVRHRLDPAVVSAGTPFLLADAVGAWLANLLTWWTTLAQQTGVLTGSTSARAVPG